MIAIRSIMKWLILKEAFATKGKRISIYIMNILTQSVKLCSVFEKSLDSPNFAQYSPYISKKTQTHPNMDYINNVFTF
jgi:hypothetical protein